MLIYSKHRAKWQLGSKDVNSERRDLAQVAHNN